MLCGTEHKVSYVKIWILNTFMMGQKTENAVHSDDELYEIKNDSM